MTKVAYNNCFGGFGLSYAGVMRYASIKGIKIYGFVSDRKRDGSIDFDKYIRYTPTSGKDAFCIHYRTTDNWDDEDGYWSDRDIDRADPALIQVIEELGDAAGGQCSSLAIRDVPDGSKYRIDEYDGNERVMLADDYDWQTA